MSTEPYEEKRLVTIGWLKMVIAIVVQSMGIGYYLAALQSDIKATDKDLQDYKVQVNKEFATVMSVTQMKFQLDQLVLDSNKHGEFLKRLDEKTAILKDDIKDISRDVKNLQAEEKKNNPYSRSLSK